MAKLIDEKTATTFATREECQAWINQRVMRFKATFRPMLVGPGQNPFVLQKHTGQVVDTAQPGFKSYAFDEPLNKIAKPVRSGDLWRAVIPTEAE